MASLLDLVSVYAPSGPEAGFVLADIERRKQVARDTAAIGSERITRDFTKFDLPELQGGQAARGAFNSSATLRKTSRLSNQAGDRLSDIAYGLANTEAELAANALLAQTGIRLGGSGY